MKYHLRVEIPGRHLDCYARGRGLSFEDARMRIVDRCRAIAEPDRDAIESFGWQHDDSYPPRDIIVFGGETDLHVVLHAWASVLTPVAMGFVA